MEKSHTEQNRIYFLSSSTPTHSRLGNRIVKNRVGEKEKKKKSGFGERKREKAVTNADAK